MVSERELAILVHAVLQRAGYSPAVLPATPGYVVAANKTFADQPAEVEVSHIPRDDDPHVHAEQYYRTLVSDQTLAGVAIQLVLHPDPKVLVRSG